MAMIAPPIAVARLGRGSTSRGQGARHDQDYGQEQEHPDQQRGKRRGAVRQSSSDGPRRSDQRLEDAKQEADGAPASHKQPAPPRGVLRWLLSLPVYLYRARLGFLLGHRFLVLVHEGRRTGRRHETPLEVVRYDRSTEEATVVAAWGRKTAWLHNVEVGLARQVWIGPARYVPAVRRLDVDEAVAVLERYELRSGLPRSLVWAVLSRLLGWRYDGTPAARRRAAEQLPSLAFCPVSQASPRRTASYTETLPQRHR
ncbi:MAG TPA: hypothetical protein VGB34_03640 [Candidatus Limnocylindria bacterium]